MRGFRFPEYSLPRMRSLGFVTRSFSSQKERLRGRLVSVDFGGFFSRGFDLRPKMGRASRD